MARFDLYGGPEGSLLLEVQADLFDHFGTRVVIPLVAPDRTPRPIARLHPEIVIDTRRFVLATHLLATVPGAILAAPIGNLAHERDRITAALDMLFRGF